ncbi:MAG: hypothetical protein QXW80_04995 [Candidatus Micrarchaeia archaeon]
MSSKVIYHLDANILLNYFIEDVRDAYETVREKLTRRNWYDEVYRINIYALGETWKNILMKLNFPSSDPIFENKLENFKRQISEGHIEIFEFKEMSSSNSDWITHYKAIDRLDLLIQKADKLNIAFFCSDAEAQTFYTIDSDIIKSTKLSDYLIKINKKIKEFR